MRAFIFSNGVTRFVVVSKNEETAQKDVKAFLENTRWNAADFNLVAVCGRLAANIFSLPYKLK